MIMKKIYFTLSIIATLILTACSGTGNQEGDSYDIFSDKVKTKLIEKYNDVHSHMENGLCIVWSKEEGHKIGDITADRNRRKTYIAENGYKYMDMIDVS